MRRKRTVLPAAVTTLALAGTVATTGPAAAAPGRPCAPAWDVKEAPGPATDVGDMYTADVVGRDDVWFGGWVEPGRPWVTRWDGRELKEGPQVSPLPGGDPMLMYSMSMSSDRDGWMLMTLINNLTSPAERWHDGRWTLTPTATSPDPARMGYLLQDIASVSGEDAWAVGITYEAAPDVVVGAHPTGALVEHWDGSQWTVVDNPLAGRDGARLRAVRAITPSNVWAVGHEVSPDDEIVPLAMHWDGRSWTVVPTPATVAPASLSDVNGVRADDLWAVGTKTNPADGLAVPMVQHWDGTRWTEMTGLPDFGNAAARQVAGTGDGQAWATVEIVQGVPELLHWTGRKWERVLSPGPKAFGLRYFYAGIDGTASGDVWAAGTVYNQLHTGTAEPQIATLECGKR